MINLDESLSANFTLGELLASETAERNEALKAEQYAPPGEVVENLRYLVSKALQPIRESIGISIRITSGYRSPRVNQLVGSKPTSQHLLGQAADCQLRPSFTTDPASAAVRERLSAEFHQATGRSLKPNVSANFFLFVAVCLRLDELDVDQVIHEFGEGYGKPAWVHIAASRQRDRREAIYVGKYTDGRYVKLSAKEAMIRGGAA